MDTEKHFSDLLSEFKNGMLVTRTGEVMHARPMHVAGLSNDGCVYLATSIASPKVDEITAQPNVLLTFQANSQFVMLSGKATVTRDRAMIEKLWSDTWKVWFPGGKDDPELCLLEIHPGEGEYWDNSGAKGVRYMIEGLKAIFQERKPETDASQHAKVDLG
jgi:general stress protein 26